MRKIWIAFLIIAPCLFAYGDEKNCKEVSGGIVTNFLTESGTVSFGTGSSTGSGKQFVATTLGTATGDLAGGLGVYIYSISPFPPSGPTIVAKVHHHWVTEAGDTIFAEDATLNAFKVGPLTGVYATGDKEYTVNIIGGTGRFAGATGTLYATGVVDTNQGKVILRYQGTICFTSQD